MPVGSADAASSATAPSQSAVAGSSTDATLGVHVKRVGSVLRYHATVRMPSGADDVRLDGAFGQLTVTAKDGFVPDGSGYRLREGRTNATLTASFDLSEQRSTPLGAVGPDGPFQATEGWAFAPSPRYQLRWTTDGTVQSTRLRDAQTPGGSPASVVSADQQVAVGERFVFLGPHSVRTEAVDGQTVRVVVPEAASFRVGTERTLELARTVNAEAGVTPSRPVTAFVLPGAVRANGGASGTDIWVQEDAGELTVAHEFAHAALRLPTTEQTRWLSEAAAEYLAYQASHDERVTAKLRERVADADAVLAEQASWESDHVAYRKGAAVLAMLDDRIRTVTDGEESLTAVLAELSSGARTVDAAHLGAAVAGVADADTATWLDEQMTGTARATLPATRASGFVSGDAFDRSPGTGVPWPLSPVSLGALVVAGWMLWKAPMRVGYRRCRRVASRGFAR